MYRDRGKNKLRKEGLEALYWSSNVQRDPCTVRREVIKGNRHILLVVGIVACNFILK